MRLIDADLLMRKCEKWLKQKAPDEDEMVSLADIAVSMLMEIEEQPTAFDAEKVVALLEEELKSADDEKARCIKENPMQFDEAKGYARGIATAIEIVKGGIADAEDAKDTNVHGKWIPCSERLPKDRQIVVADIECSIEGRMCIFAYLKIVDYMGRWINANTGFPVLANVVKWTPLPEPYREVTDEENLESRR